MITSKTKLNFKQCALILGGIGLAFLVFLNKVFSWEWPWYLSVLPIVVALYWSALAVNISDQTEKASVLAHMAGRPPLCEEQFGKQFFRSDRAETAVRLRMILARLIAVDLSRMQPDDRFIEDLRMDALDSMSTVEFVLEVEKEFAIEIPDAAAEKMATFRNVVDYVANAVNVKLAQVSGERDHGSHSRKN